LDVTIFIVKRILQLIHLVLSRAALFDGKTQVMINN
jgi:hypothetical protein